MSREFSEPPMNYKANQPPQTPFMKGYAEWDKRIGSAKQEAYLWRCSFFIVLFVLLVCIGGLVAQSLKSSVMPYVIETNADGSARAIGPAKEGTYVPKEAEIKHFLAQFVMNSRRISLDRVDVVNSQVRAYAFLKPVAAAKMNEVMKLERFEERMQQETSIVKVSVVLPQSPNSYQVRWTEDIFSKDGTLKRSVKMSGIFAFEVIQPKTEKELLVNPLGLYITDFSWSREM